MKLCDTSLIVLSGAAGRDDRLVPRRASVPPVADINACRALVKQGLVEVVCAPLGVTDIVAVREDDSSMGFVIADAGFRALNLDPAGSAGTAATDAATAPYTADDGEAAHDTATPGEGQSGLGMEAQQASVRTFIGRQARTLVAEFSDIASGKDDHPPGFQAALARCRQLGAMLVSARLDRITRRAHTLSQLLEDGYSIRAADMPGADDLMMRIYAAMAQKERS